MNKVIVLVGPTGVGKTKLSIELAKQLNGEIISGDAYQVYKQLSIGSAKITQEEMQGIQHYLVDCIDYKDAYSVKVFQEKARQYIQDIINKGKVPIVCGGTGLYIKALLYDYEFQEEQVDAQYKATLEALDNDCLYERLQAVDLKACEKIHKNNRQRVIRALLMANSGECKSDRIEKQQHTLLYDAYIIGLTMPREQLYAKIDERVEMMMQQGLKEEVESIVEDISTFLLQSMQGIGYKEWKPYFLQIEEEELVKANIQKNTRNFAKRQYTWFKNQMDVHWYDKEDEMNAIEDAKRFIHGSCENF